MTFTDSATHQTPLIVTIMASSTDLLADGSTSRDYCCVTATVERWLPRLVERMLGQKNSDDESFTTEQIANRVMPELLEFMRSLAHSRVISQDPSTSINTEAYDIKLGSVAKLKSEAAANTDGLLAFEAAVISFFANHFDGYAAIDLEVQHDGRLDLVKLCTGDASTDQPPFGRAKSVPMRIETANQDAQATIQFIGDSPMLREIMSAGPAELRSTPAGRKDLAFLFLENEIEIALGSPENSEVAYEIIDATMTRNPTISIVLAQASTPATSPSYLAAELTRRWPEIFS